MQKYVKLNQLNRCIILVFWVVFAYANERLIIKYKPTVNERKQLAIQQLTEKEIRTRLYNTPLSAATIKQISAISGTQVKEVSKVGNGAHVIELYGEIAPDKLHQIIDQQRSDSQVEYIEIDHIVKMNDVVNDNVISGVPIVNPAQWDMVSSSTSLLLPTTTWYGDNFSAAWGMGLIGSGIIVAVLDTGYTPHPNIINGLQSLSGTSCTANGANASCYGYQFISNCLVAGSANCSVGLLPPQIDALDTGTFVTANDLNSEVFNNAGCGVQNSIWHGTHIMGDIVGDGGMVSSIRGVVGGAYGAKVLPIRVLGKCGMGFDSDIANGIFWAVNQLAGLSNPNPAQVISLSLGSQNTCGATMQQAIDTAIASGAVVVVAAGNNAGNVSQFSPANCNGVIAVSARGSLQELSFYSNWGSTIITASGGNDVTRGGQPNNIWSSIWQSQGAYVYNNGNNAGFTYMQGTSMATPHVSGAVADILVILRQASQSVVQTNTVANIDLVKQILQNSATPLSNSCNNGQFIQSGSGGCVANLELNVGSAAIYTQGVLNGSIGVLIPSTNPISISNIGTNVTITFTNGGKNSVTVSSLVLSNLGVFSVVDDSCSRQTVAVNASCQITLMQVTLGLMPVTLQLFSTTNSGFILSTVVLSPVSVIQPLPASGGGCAMVQNGNDLSQLLILGLLVLWYGYRQLLVRSNGRIE